MQEHIRGAIEQSIRLHEGMYGITAQIEAAARIMTQCIAQGNKIMFAGNGGSAADAQHLAAELANRFLKDRRPLPGLALTTDTSVITAIGNDASFDEIFSKQIQALGRTGDVFFGISTSGNSPNVIRAFAAAHEQGILTIALTGDGGGAMHDMADCTIAVPSRFTPRVQEMHILVGHILCGLIEDACC